MMINLGKKEKRYDQPVSAVGKKGVIQYPDFNVSDIELPVGEKDIGKTVTATVQLKVKKAGHEIDDYENPDKKTYRAAFRVLAIDFNKKKVDVKNTPSNELDDLERSEHEKMTLTRRG